MKESKYNLLTYNNESKKNNIFPNLNPKHVENLQECLYNLTIFSYDVVLIKIAKNNLDIIRTVSAIRMISYVPLLVVTDTKINQVREIVYAGCDIVLDINCDNDNISIQLWTLARRYRLWIKESPNYGIIKKGKLTIDKKQYTVKWSGIKIDLTRQAHEFLCLIAMSPNRIYTFEQIYQLVWKDYPVDNIQNIIWCLVKRLRKKLNAVEINAGNCITSVRNIGYKFELNKEKEQQ